MNQRPRVAVIVNPAAGGDVEGVVAAIEAVGTAEVQTFETVAAGDAADLAYKAAADEVPPDIVISVGGDGTVAEVVTGLCRARESGAIELPPLLVAPGGTGNSTYRGLWNDEAWETVADRALRGNAVTRTIDLARIEQSDHVVVLGSGSGLFAATLLAARDRPENEKGRERLMAAALAAMDTYVPYPGRVSVDGKPIYEGDIIETIVAGFRYRGGLLQLVPESILDDHLLDITLVTSAADMGDFAQAAIHGNVYDVPGIHAGRGSRITIERLDGRPVLFEHDGELMPETTPVYEMRVVPAALTVLTTAARLPWFSAR